MTSKTATSNFDPKVLLATYWDSKDVTGFVNCFASDASWKVNTSPDVVGLEAIEGLTKAIMATSKSSRHHDLKVVCQEEESAVIGGGTTTSIKPKTYVIHGAVEYGMLDESKPNVICRFCDVMEMNTEGNKIMKCWTYMDTTPLTK